MRLKGNSGSKLPPCRQRSLLSHWVDAQAEQSFRLAHKTRCWFCCVLAHMSGVTQSLRKNIRQVENLLADLCRELRFKGFGKMASFLRLIIGHTDAKLIFHIIKIKEKDLVALLEYS